MRILFLFLSGILFLTLAYPLWANEDALRQRILNHIRAASSRAEIQLPRSEIATRPRHGPNFYRSLVGEDLNPRLVKSVVYIVTEGGVTGAGTVISSSFGLIITNWHLVGNDKVVSLVFKPRGSTGAFSFDKDDIFFARVLFTDYIRDLALLEIVSRPRKLIAAPLGSTTNLRAGHQVFSVSHPRGSLWSYSEGTISQLNPSHEWVRGMGIVHRANTIQTQPDVAMEVPAILYSTRTGNSLEYWLEEQLTSQIFAISIDEIRDFVFSSLR